MSYDQRRKLLSVEDRASYDHLVTLSSQLQEESEDLELLAQERADHSRFAWSTAQSMLQQAMAEIEAMEDMEEMSAAHG